VGVNVFDPYFAPGADILQHYSGHYFGRAGGKNGAGDGALSK
jgi:hypothetical protein